MSETKKFTEEELTQIKNLQSQNDRVIYELGQAELQIFLMSEELEKLKEHKSTLQITFKNFQAEETDLVAKLNEKYGIGTVDINTGEFIPQN